MVSPDGDSLFLNDAKKSKQKTLAPTYGPRKLGSLRSRIDPGAAATVCFAAPPCAVSGCARRSLRSHARIDPSTQPSDVAGGSRSKALELTLIVEWLEAGGWLWICGVAAPHRNAARPALSLGRGGRFVGRSKLAYGSVFQVGVALTSTSISPLSLRERARVRGF